MKGNEAKARVVIEGITPQLDGGLFAVKRVPGELVTVEADVFGDGHDVVSARLAYRKKTSSTWSEVPLKALENDRWSGMFLVQEQGYYEYTVVAWIDHPLTWHEGFCKKAVAGELLQVELKIGADFLKSMAKIADSADHHFLLSTAKVFENEAHYNEAVVIAKSERIEELIKAYPLRENESRSTPLNVFVEPPNALFSSWYEFFPRSSSPDHSRAGTLNDCTELLPLIAELGFDTLYFPPIHPIGVSHRKGKNNSTVAHHGEPGSPWAIGSEHGGHKSINPELGTMDDFENLIRVANQQGIKIALDLAYQCSPDHPYVKEHPAWFKWRPDGTVQYAENPPKKYQDVLPLNFETSDWKNLWDELKSIIEFWIGKGVQVFRVDNPHTKPFVFWQWLMGEMRKDHPDVIFLSEAFTRPKIMARLAKVGFQQSYSYFTWRQTKEELTEYLTELTTTELREYFRTNFWPNTPDILPVYLQQTGHAHSAVRYLLAATLSSNYGMYGPVYEMLVNTPVPGKEEYHNSEKYEVKHWDWKAPNRMRDLIKQVNRIRKDYAAFHSTFNCVFCETDNEHMIAYLKKSSDASNSVLCVVNLDPNHKQSGWVKLPLDVLQVSEGHAIEMHDLIDGKTYSWNRQWNYVELDPRLIPGHLFHIRLHSSI
jgi:starch synthase (maltosyl-transferring)